MCMHICYHCVHTIVGDNTAKNSPDNLFLIFQVIIIVQFFSCRGEMPFSVSLFYKYCHIERYGVGTMGYYIWYSKRKMDRLPT